MTSAVKVALNPIQPTNQIERVADDNFKFDQNGRNFSEWVESTVEKGEIARYEQFLLNPPCFQKTCTPET